MSHGFPSFTIKHFAATVTYTGTNMLEKNRDNLAADIVNALQASEMDLVSDVFNGEILPTGQIRARKRTEEETKVRRGSVVQAQPDGKSNTSNRRAPSLSSQFKNSLGVLIDRMTKCHPHFIRCIKPNLDQRPEMFVDDFVRTQLSYTGVLEATRIRQEGYSWRPEFAEFVRRYKIIGFPITKQAQVKESEASAVKIIRAAKLQNWQVGKTKLFLKYYHLTSMEEAMKKFYKDVVRTQNAFRSRKARRELAKRKERKRMSDEERAVAEARDREEQARLEAKAMEQRKLEKERADAEAAAKHAEMAAKQADAQKAEMEAKKAEMEALKLQEEAAAEKAMAEAEKARQEAELERQEREKAIAEREVAIADAEMKQQELDRLTEAAERARQEAAAAAEEMKKQSIERTKSRKKRKDDAARQAELARVRAEEEARTAEEARLAREKAEEEARLAEEKRRADEAAANQAKEAGYQEAIAAMQAEAARARELAELQKRQAEQAEKARLTAEAAAKKAEEERLAELQRLADEQAVHEAEERAADYTRKDFSLATRVKFLLKDSPVISKEVIIEDRCAKGWMIKLGHARKTWQKRFFVLNLDDMVS